MLLRSAFVMAKVVIISGMVCALSSGCKKAEEAKKTAATSTPPRSAVALAPSPAEKAPPLQPWDTQGRINQIKKELCDDCAPESSECEVVDLYEFPQDGKAPRRLIAFSSPGRGLNSSYTVILSTKDACTPVLEPSGINIGFIAKPDKNQFPDIGVTNHWSVEESVETGYHWDGHNYVAEESVKINARTGEEERL